MIYRTLEQVQASKFDVDFGNGRSRRFLTERDHMGFTLTDTVINAGSESELQYARHLEACYCLSGDGELQVGERVYALEPGVLYAPNEHDRHIVRAKTELRFVCVFLPALSGDERHSAGAGASGY
ncbi:MAG: ectoine synthase [bacterium]